MFIVKFNSSTPDLIEDENDFRGTLLRAMEIIEQGHATIAHVMQKDFWGYRFDGLIYTSHFTNELVYTPRDRVHDVARAKAIMTFSPRQHFYY